MVSISIVYPTLLSSGPNPKVWGQDYPPHRRLRETVGSLTARLNREICILMGQSYIVLFTLPFSQYVYNYYPHPYGALAREPPSLQPLRTAPASDLTSFRRRHYRRSVAVLFLPDEAQLNFISKVWEFRYYQENFAIICKRLNTTKNVMSLKFHFESMSICASNVSAEYLSWRCKRTIGLLI